MQHRILHSIGRFFAGAGHVISTPSGDARGHMRVPIDTMNDVSSADHIMGR